MDAFELLKADHKKVAELFDQLESASGDAKLEVFSQIKSELDVHTHVEETIFYPVLERPEKTHDLTLEAYEEHKVVKTLLSELAGATTATDEWEAQAKVLRENVEHHVDEEENELFDKAGEVLTDVEIEELGNRMEAEKARKQGQPAPEQPIESDKAPEASDSKPGILAKIADFVGLGSAKASKKAGKKATKKTAPKKAATKPAPKKAAAKPPTKKAAPKKAAKAAAKTATKKTASRKASKVAAKTVTKKAATKKAATRKGSKAPARTAAKKTAPRKSAKAAAKSTKKAGKAKAATTKKRPPQGSKKGASRPSGSKKASGAAQKKSAKKRSGRKR